MSKHPLQFLEVPRRDPDKEDAEQRVQHYGEIYGHYDGADAAATLLIEAESEGLRIELGAVAVGSTVAVFTLEGAGSADEVGAELMTLGVAKIAAG